MTLVTFKNLGVHIIGWTTLVGQLWLRGSAVRRSPESYMWKGETLNRRLPPPMLRHHSTNVTGQKSPAEQTGRVSSYIEGAQFPVFVLEKIKPQIEIFII